MSFRGSTEIPTNFLPALTINERRQRWQMIIDRFNNLIQFSNQPDNVDAWQETYRESVLLLQLLDSLDPERFAQPPIYPDQNNYINFSPQPPYSNIPIISNSNIPTISNSNISNMQPNTHMTNSRYPPVEQNNNQYIFPVVNNPQPKYNHPQDRKRDREMITSPIPVPQKPPNFVIYERTETSYPPSSVQSPKNMRAKNAHSPKKKRIL